MCGRTRVSIRWISTIYADWFQRLNRKGGITLDNLTMLRAADAALKIASARQGFANTDVFLEMLGFSQADIRRIKAQEVLVRGMSVLEGLEA